MKKNLNCPPVFLQQKKKKIGSSCIFFNHVATPLLRPPPPAPPAGRASSGGPASRAPPPPPSPALATRAQPRLSLRRGPAPRVPGLPAGAARRGGRWACEGGDGHTHSATGGGRGGRRRAERTRPTPALPPPPPSAPPSSQGISPPAPHALSAAAGGRTRSGAAWVPWAGSAGRREQCGRRPARKAGPGVILEHVLLAVPPPARRSLSSRHKDGSPFPSFPRPAAPSAPRTHLGRRLLHHRLGLHPLHRLGGHRASASRKQGQVLGRAGGFKAASPAIAVSRVFLRGGGGHAHARARTPRPGTRSLRPRRPQNDARTLLAKHQQEAEQKGADASTTCERMRRRGGGGRTPRADWPPPPPPAPSRCAADCFAPLRTRRPAALALGGHGRGEGRSRPAEGAT